MLEKVKSFFNNLFNFGTQNQGLKRERDSLNDESETETSVVITSATPSRKKIKLNVVGLADRENHEPIMSATNRKSSASSRLGRWGITNNSKEALNSVARTSTSKEEDIIIVHSEKEVSSSINKETFTFKKSLLHKPLANMESSTQAGESGSSLRKLEKLMTETLADAMPNKVKKPDTPFRSPEFQMPFTFTPLATASLKGSQGPVQSVPNSRFSRSSSKSIDSDLRKRAINNGGSVQKPQYRPMFQKLYGTAKNQRGRSLSTSISTKNCSQSLGIQSCIRIDEKLCYKALLSQFVPKGFYDGITSPVTSSLSNSRSSSGIFIERSPREKETFSIERQEQANDKKPAVSRNASVIDLANESKNEQEYIGAVKKTLVYDSPLKQVLRINSLEEALTLSPQYDTKFVADLKARFSAKERERQRLLAEEEIRCKVLAENREEWESQLEQRLRMQLEITAPVLDERPEEKVVLPEITDEMQMVIDKALKGYAESEVLCDAFNLTITRKDIKTLVGLNWLNDQVVNFYLTLVMERSNAGKDLPKVYAFNTFFYPKLISSGHPGLKRWTRKVNLFEKDYILIPVHLGMHWCLATISPTEKAIRYYDSMGGRNQECLTSLRTYIEAESLDKKKTALDTSDWTVECVEEIPQQMNGSDCGMFACKYAEYIARRAKITFDQKDMPYFRRRMVYEIVTRKLIHP